jgi:long-subunit fatty acid transport protein
VRFAVGVFAPQGYPERHFDERVDVGTSDDAPSPQRYDNMEQRARIIMPSLAVAWSPLANLDVGVRVGWGYAQVHGRKSVWSITNYEEFEGSDSIFTVNVHDRFIPGGTVGVLWRPARPLEVGATWQSPMHVYAHGTGSSRLSGGFGSFTIETQPVPDEFALCDKGGTAVAFKSCLSLDVPQMATVGARWIFRDARGGERGDLEVDVAWEDWSNASDTHILVDAQVVINDGPFLLLNESLSRHGFQDVWSVRAGGSWAVQVGGHRVELRAGAAHDTRTAPLSWTRVDLDGKPRTTVAAGLGVSAGRYRVDLGGGVVLEPDRTVAQCKPPDGPTLQDRGCGNSGADTDYFDRTAPDVGQPLQGTFNQFEAPFNAGTYRSGYVLLHLGLTVAL